MNTAVLVLQAEHQRHTHTGGERHDDADDGDGERCGAHLAELAQVHLHAHLQQQEEHADLGEHAQRHAAIRSARSSPAPTGR